MKYGLIAEKLSHSFSKEIHNALFNYEYELCEIPKDKLGEFMINREFNAINVTIPYKEAVIPYLDFIDDNARKIGAVNTVVNKDGKLYGYNTDYMGMLALINNAKIEIANKKVLILGSGGTSKTAEAVATALGASEIVKLSRTAKEGYITYSDAEKIHNDADVIINTTPCGMYPDVRNSPIDISKYKDLSAVVDVIYNPLISTLVFVAKERGIKAVGGLYMLVAQAAFAAEKFIGEYVSPEKIREVYINILKSKQNIVLVGMPGSGKSTVGRFLAEMTGKELVDTDKLIVEREKMPITEIFEKYGENVFRDMESKAIEELSICRNLVISTGGGAILRQINIDMLKQNGIVYFLDRPLEELKATADRPLSSNKTDMEKRYNERYDLYLFRSDKQIKTTGIPRKTAEKILEDFNNENTCN